jgi:hypothetical protein
MPTPPLSPEKARRTVEMVERCLKEGYTPPDVPSEKSAIREAAKRLGDREPTVRSRIYYIKQRHEADPKSPAPPDWSLYKPLNHSVPDGQKVKGLSTLYDAGGNVVMEWVKTTADQQRQEEIFREALAAMAESLPRTKPVKAPAASLDHLMAMYPVGDHHMGMLSWAEETGGNYDIDIGERLLSGAMEHLVKATPGCSEAAILLLGDFMHYDSMVAVTPTGKNVLDADGRFPKMVRAAIRSIRRMVATALQHHAKVRLVIEIGNHDLASSIFLMEAMAALYEDEPRVTVDTSPRHYHYFSFGECLVGTHHGHGAKMQELPLIMAADQPELWGTSKFRMWLTGHIHTSKKLSAEDFAGCTVESFRILAPADAWAANKGYRAQRDMKAIVLHKQYGEVARYSVNPSMLENT